MDTCQLRLGHKCGECDMFGIFGMDNVIIFVNDKTDLVRIILVVWSCLLKRRTLALPYCSL